MSEEMIDVTYTRKESEADGRRLMRNTVTGEEFWVRDEVQHLPLQPSEDKPKPKPKRGKKK